MRPLKRHSMAMSLLLLALGMDGRTAPAGAAGNCGFARPNLDSIATAEGLVIAPDGTIYFSQPFVGSNTQYLAR